MSSDLKYSFASAHKVANYIADLLMPHCTRLHVAGSARRLRPEIGDIEIVCEPKRVQEQTDLFGGGPLLIDKCFTEALMTITDEIVRGDINGRMMQIKTTSKICPGIKLDLFMPSHDDYYRILAIRTGSAEYAQHFIASAWKRKGWVGVKDLGLRKISDCVCTTDANNKKHYKLIPGLENPAMPAVLKSEGEFFTWLGIDYIDPQLREFHKPINEAQ